MLDSGKVVSYNIYLGMSSKTWLDHWPKKDKPIFLHGHGLLWDVHFICLTIQSKYLKSMETSISLTDTRVAAIHPRINTDLSETQFYKFAQTIYFATRYCLIWCASFYISQAKYLEMRYPYHPGVVFGTTMDTKIPFSTACFYPSVLLDLISIISMNVSPIADCWSLVSPRDLFSALGKMQGKEWEEHDIVSVKEDDGNTAWDTIHIVWVLVRANWGA